MVPISFNSLECKGNYSATSNNMKLVHWPLMGGLLVTFGTVMRGLGGAAARSRPSSLYQMQQLSHQRPVYQSPYCCTTVRSLCGFNVPVKGLSNEKWRHLPLLSVVKLFKVVRHSRDKLETLLFDDRSTKLRRRPCTGLMTGQRRNDIVRVTTSKSSSTMTNISLVDVIS